MAPPLTVESAAQRGEVRGRVGEVERGGALHVAGLGHGQRARGRQRAAARARVRAHDEVQQRHRRLLRLRPQPKQLHNNTNIFFVKKCDEFKNYTISKKIYSKEL